MIGNEESRFEYDNYLKQLKLEGEKQEEDKIENTISNDFEFNCENNVYFKNCNRCGGKFTIRRKDFEELILNSNSIFVNLQCDSCSLTLNVLLL